MHYLKDFPRFTQSITSLLAIVVLMQQVTAARDLKDHRRLARRAVQSNCPTGYTSSKVEDPFTSTKQDFWQVKKHADGLKYTGDGLEMHTNEANPATIIESSDSWGPPLKLSFSAQAQNFGGIVNSVAFLKFYEVGEIVNASEIDLEIVPGQFQLPLWVESGDPTKAYRLQPGTEITETLKNGAVLDTSMTVSYAYRYPGYDPAVMTKYEMTWENDVITWTIGGSDRVQFSRKTGVKFPSGPLPLRIGPWVAKNNPGANWAGVLDWQARPEAMFLIKDLVLEGCKG